MDTRTAPLSNPDEISCWGALPVGDPSNINVGHSSRDSKYDKLIPVLIAMLVLLGMMMVRKMMWC